MAHHLRPELQRADPRARRNAVVVVAVGTIVGLLAIAAYTHHQSALEQWLVEPDAPVDLLSRLRLLVVGVAVFVTMPSVGFAVYLWRMGARVIRAERFPPPGTAVIRDTPIVIGNKARRHGRRVQAAGVVIALTSVAMPVLLWSIVVSVSSGR